MDEMKATPAPWPEDPTDAFCSEETSEIRPPDVLLDRDDYEHARACVNFVARLEAALSTHGVVSLHKNTVGRCCSATHEGGQSKWADNLTDLLAQEDA